MIPPFLALAALRIEHDDDVIDSVGKLCGESPASGNIPTVSLGVTYAVAYTYGCDDGRISPTRCAVIDAALGALVKRG
jgi:hypothetical protein